MQLKLMAEYECYPIWLSEDGVPVNMDPKFLLISDHLKKDIIKWSETYEATYIKENPIDSGFKNETEYRKFVEEGHILLNRLKKELGSSYEVFFKV